MRVHVVSAQFPCGAAWLANALLELEVAISNLWGFPTAAEWQRDNEGVSHYIAQHLPWRQTLAGLVPGRRFRFRPGIDVRFSHEFPWQGADADLVILMVRDPRDALHSEWRREQRNAALPGSVDLPEFTASPFAQGPISQRDLLWLHGCCWLRERAAPRVVRFEDCKQDPVGQLHAIASWLGLQPPLEALERAAAASDVKHLQVVETELASRDPQARQFNRRGQPYEWRATWPPHWHRSFGTHWSALLASMGYEGPQQSGEARPEFDIAEVLRWRGLPPGEEFDAWAAAIEGWMA